MRQYQFFNRVAWTWSLFILVIAACAPNVTPPPPTNAAPTVVPTLTSAPVEESTTTPADPLTQEGLVVAFVRDGNIQVWEEATGQSETIHTSGDVRAVSMSADGQVIVFTRHSWVGDVLEGYEQHSLWAVDRSGANARELVSAESLRQRLNAGERDSTNISQMEWIPGTHRMLFSGWKYIVQAEGESHAVPEGLNLIDVDSATDVVLIPAENYLRFAVSPDGQQVALMSFTGLSFMNVDGSNVRTDVLTYPQIGQAGPLFPTGVWTQDSRAFVITGSFEADARFNINFTIWRVPADGSSPEALTSITASDPRSVTFSPDGQRAAFIQSLDQQALGSVGWFITPLTGNISPLAIPSDYDMESTTVSLHWSPAGDPFTRNLRKLCPDATRDTEECDSPIYFDGTVAAIHWIDGARFLFLTRDPAVLFLGKMDGTTIPIATWPLGAVVNAMSFTAASAGP